MFFAFSNPECDWLSRSICQTNGKTKPRSSDPVQQEVPSEFDHAEEYLVGKSGRVCEPDD